jgi:predicted RNA binding protein YcfA (HicA-like mRNA interferase family)
VSEAPLCSSRQIINALSRAGFLPARSATGDHQAFVRVNEDGTKDICIVVLGQRQVARYTLRNILKQARISEEEFRFYLR